MVKTLSLTPLFEQSKIDVDDFLYLEMGRPDRLHLDYKQ